MWESQCHQPEPMTGEMGEGREEKANFTRLSSVYSMAICLVVRMEPEGLSWEGSPQRSRGDAHESHNAEASFNTKAQGGLPGDGQADVEPWTRASGMETFERPSTASRVNRIG
jgi:hypothetical protein